MQTRHKIGILGATGVIGQRFIQLLEGHPWFEITWLAASDKSSGKSYGEAVRWKLDTPLPSRIAAMMVSPAAPEGAPGVIFAALDTDIARELEPKFAAAGCAVISNSSAFRMQADVPLVIPEVNAAHLGLLETQDWRKQSGGYIVTNPNCSAIGLVLALKPLADRFGLESVFVSTMQAVSGAGYPGVPSLDILGNVVPFIRTEEEKLEAETLKLLGKLNGTKVEALPARVSAHCNRVAVEDGHTECVSIKLSARATREEILAAWNEFAPLAGYTLPTAPIAAGRVQRCRRPAAAAAGPHARQRDGGYCGPFAPLLSAGLEVRRPLTQHHSRWRGCGGVEWRVPGCAGQACSPDKEARSAQRYPRSRGCVRMKPVVMKFGGTSVEDATAILRTAKIVAGRLARGQRPVVVVSAMAKVTDQLLAAAKAAGRGDRNGALAISSRLRHRHCDTSAMLLPASSQGRTAELDPTGIRID